MGLLSAIGNVAKKATETFVTAVAHPIEVAKAIISPTTSVKQIEQKFLSQPLSKQITQIVTTAATTAAAVVGVGAVSTAAKAGTLIPAAVNVAKSVIPKSTTGKVVAAVAAPVVVGAVVSEPKAVAKAAVTAPSSLANFGGNVASLVVSPSLEKAKETIKENPVISTAAVIATGAAVGGGLGLAANTAATLLNTKATNANTALPETSQTIDTLPKDIKTSVAAAPLTAATGTQQIASAAPTTPKTEILTSTTGSSKKRRYKPRKPSTISQKVNIMIQNKNQSLGIRQTKTYLNRIALPM